MPVFKSAYETHACRGFVLNKVVEALENADVRGDIALFQADKMFQAIDNTYQMRAVDGRGQSGLIPTFLHPMVLKTKNMPALATSHGEALNQHIVVDVRSVTKYVPEQDALVIRNIYEYSFIGIRGYLNLYWLQNSPEYLLNVSRAPMALYARWVSENVTRRFGLDPQDQLTIAVFAAWFYYGLFREDVKLSESDMHRAVSIISKSVNVNPEFVLNVVEHLPVIQSLDTFCEMMQTVTGNVRLKEMNAGILFAIVGGTWFGANARELTAVALEHPPTWVAIVLAAYSDRSYKNTAIAKLAIRDDKQTVQSFMKGVLGLIAHPA